MPWAGKKISDIGWPRAKLEKQNNFKQFHAAQVMSRGPPGSNSEKIWRQSTHGSRLKSELRWFRTRKSRSILKLDKEWQQVTTSCKVCRFQMLSQVLSLLSVGNWSPHVDAKTYKTNPFGTDMFFFYCLFLILHGVQHSQGCRLGRGTAYAVPKSLVQGCGVKRSVRTISWSPACRHAV